MDSDTESSLIAALETSDYTGLYSRFLTFLNPFSDLVSVRPNTVQNKSKKQPKKYKEIDSVRIRALAKQFLPFLSRSLNLLPSRASVIQGDENAIELFKTYRLALDCLTTVSSCLAGKPYTIHLLRARFLRCLESSGQHDEAEQEGYSILESLQTAVSSDSAPKTQIRRKAEVYFLPGLPVGEKADQDLAALVMEVVVTIAVCVSKQGSKEDGSYVRVLGLVKQSAPWLRVLDSEKYEKFHRALVSSVYRCAIFVAAEYVYFSGDLVHHFCKTALNECLVSPMKDQFPKLARRICSTLGLQWERRSSFILDAMRCALESISCECKAGLVDIVNDILDFVYYCVNTCRNAEDNTCKSAARHLEEARSALQVFPHVACVPGLYAVGLHISDGGGIQDGLHDSTPEKSFSTLSCFLDGVHLKYLGALLISLESHIHDSGEDCGVISDYAERDQKDKSALATKSKIHVNRSCKHVHGKVAFRSYLNALAFLCKPFADHVNTAWRYVVSEKGLVTFPKTIKYIQDAFHQFCDIFLSGFSSTSDKERERLEESRRTLLHVAIASLKISLRTDGNTQKSMDYIDSVISREWVQPLEIKFLISSLYNVGVSFYKIMQLEQASVALKLCHKASWIHVLLICQQYSDKADGACDDLSQDAITDIISDACAKSALYLDVFHQCGYSSVNEIIVCSLINWCEASKSLKKLTAPMVLVKQWVKIMCKDYEVVNGEDDCPTLNCLLSSSLASLSRHMLGMIFEQELSEYTQMDARNPNLCQRMQQKIIDTLLLDIYVSEEYYLQRSRVLIRKGRLVRAYGIDGLSSSLQFLSEAISVLMNIFEVSSSGSSSMSHQLALAHCLRALCTQEVDQNSKVILNDISSAVKLWANLNAHRSWASDDLPELAADSAIVLLCHIADLLSLKGNLNFHYNIQKLIIDLCNWTNISLERCLACLWGDRRLNHSLCVLPIEETFMLNLSQQLGVHVDSTDYWIRCIGSSPPSLLGFRQQFLLLDSCWPKLGRCAPKRSLDSDFSIDETRKAAAALISTVPIRSCSAFVAGHLYFDLCERLLSSARPLEAISYAREALRLRTILLRRKFLPSQQSNAKEIVVRNKDDPAHLVTVGSVATDIWPDNFKPLNIEGTILSPWGVLRCYLESTLQVAIIHEIVGNGADAEALSLVGKRISVLQNLPLFIVAFASLLGQIYCKKELLDQAEYELNYARQILVDGDDGIFCKKCKLAWEATLDMQIGDLIRSRVTINKRIQSLDCLLCPLELYKTALEKLNIAELENALSIYGKSHRKSVMNGKVCREVDRSLINVDAEKSNKSKNTAKNFTHKENSKCSLRSQKAYQSSCMERFLVDGQLGTEFHGCSSKIDGFISSDGSLDRKLSEPNSDFNSDFMEAGSMWDAIHMRWGSHRKRLLLKLLAKMGKWLEVQEKFHEVHKIFCQSISLLFNKKPLSNNFADDPDALYLIEKGNPGDLFAAEWAEVLYNICWHSIKNYKLDHLGTQCCVLSNIQIPRIVSWLLQVFVLCRELPSLLKKVSRLLSVLFLASVLSQSFSFPLYMGKTLSASHWAAYFHQASIGTSLLPQFQSNVSCGNKSEGSTSEALESYSCHFTPDRVDELEGYVCHFFKSLPIAAVVCISFLGDDYGGLLGQILSLQSSFPAWMLLSRLELKQQPVVMLLPVNLIPEDFHHDSIDYDMVAESNELSQKWVCPWGYTVVDTVSPQFRSILTENYQSTFTPILDDTQRSRFLWWARRTRLNERLERFLREMEDSWLGSWRCLLLGEPSNREQLNIVTAKLMRDLKRKCKFEAHQCILRAILGGAMTVGEVEECVSELLTYKGYFGSGGCYREAKQVSPKGGSGVDGLAHQLILEAIVALADGVDREPVILVLDADIQMLPWENMPVLRRHEVYRMPSVDSISRAMNRSQTQQLHAEFPSIDPMDAYYLLNPSGDLRSTQDEFEEYFRNRNWKGKAGTVPSPEEISSALQEHNLFLYFGHGSGIQYIPGHTIKKLNNCAASLLMGCSSGVLSFTGPYAPQGAPLSYLLAGSPAIIANLWDVTDREIDRFGRVILDDWLQEESGAQMGCLKCCQLVKELTSMHIGDGGKYKTPRTRRNAARGKEKLQEPCCSCEYGECGSKVRFASFMSRARDNCKLQFLTGASPVCYGVPTVMRKKQ